MVFSNSCCWVSHFTLSAHDQISDYNDRQPMIQNMQVDTVNVYDIIQIIDSGRVGDGTVMLHELGFECYVLYEFMNSYQKDKQHTSWVTPDIGRIRIKR